MIKIDMEMPNVCIDCKYYTSMFDDDEGIHYVCLIESKEVYVNLVKPEWCPLIECEDDAL